MLLRNQRIFFLKKSKNCAPWKLAFISSSRARYNSWITSAELVVGKNPIRVTKPHLCHCINQLFKVFQTSGTYKRPNSFLTTSIPSTATALRASRWEAGCLFLSVTTQFWFQWEQEYLRNSYPSKYKKNFPS